MVIRHIKKTYLNTLLHRDKYMLLSFHLAFISYFRWHFFEKKNINEVELLFLEEQRH